MQTGSNACHAPFARASASLRVCAANRDLPLWCVEDDSPCEVSYRQHTARTTTTCVTLVAGVLASLTGAPSAPWLVSGTTVAQSTRRVTTTDAARTRLAFSPRASWVACTQTSFHGRVSSLDERTHLSPLVIATALRCLLPLVLPLHSRRTSPACPSKQHASQSRTAIISNAFVDVHVTAP